MHFSFGVKSPYTSSKRAPFRPVPLGSPRGRGCVHPPPPSGVSPADRSRTSRWLALWTVYEIAVPERSDGFTFLGRRQVASILLDRCRCSRWQVLCVLFGSYSRVCSGTSVCGHLLRQRHQRNDFAASLKPAVSVAAHNLFRPRCCSDSSPCCCGSSTSLIGIFISESESVVAVAGPIGTCVSTRGQDVAASPMPAVVAAAQWFAILPSTFLRFDHPEHSEDC